jgi:hypothetical protein
MQMKFDVSGNKNAKRWILAFAGRRWAAFKTFLVRNYITKTVKNNKDKPWETYNFITRQSWENFVAFQESPAQKVLYSIIIPYCLSILNLRIVL